MPINTPIKYSTTLIERLWDMLCVASGIGIWPRFIEPYTLSVTHHTIPLDLLPRELSHFTIAQISDLHFSQHTSTRFLQRVIDKLHDLAPHCVVFTGDILSYAKIHNLPLMEDFLRQIDAPCGCYAIFGNHDYERYVSLGNNGEFEIVDNPLMPILGGFARLLGLGKKEKHCAIQNPIALHPELSALFARTGWKLLHNETVLVGTQRSHINLTGLGDLISGNFQPLHAFQNRDPLAPSIVLVHNPDAFDRLLQYPGDLYLTGHTHGGQVNLPFLWKKITPIKNKAYKRGFIQHDNKLMYVNRGLSSPMPFRWFASPEISLFTLVPSTLALVENFALEFVKNREMAKPLETLNSKLFYNS